MATKKRTTASKIAVWQSAFPQSKVIGGIIFQADPVPQSSKASWSGTACVDYMRNCFQRACQPAGGVMNIQRRPFTEDRRKELEGNYKSLVDFWKLHTGGSVSVLDEDGPVAYFMVGRIGGKPLRYLPGNCAIFAVLTQKLQKETLVRHLYAVLLKDETTTNGVMYISDSRDPSNG